MTIRDSYGVAHYAVDGSQIQDSYILLKVYETVSTSNVASLRACRLPAE